MSTPEHGLWDLPADRLQATVGYLLTEAQRDAGERREQAREPFFKLVSVAVAEGDEVRRFSCFSREISATGIGLLHSMPLAPGDAVLTIYCDSLGPLRVHANILWIRSCGDGWYISGAEFIDTLTETPPFIA